MLDIVSFSYIKIFFCLRKLKFSCRERYKDIDKNSKLL